MPRRIILFLGALAGLARVLYLLFAIPNYIPDKDADQYMQLARAFSNGDGLSIQWPFAYVHPSAFRPPLYPALLGSLFSATGSSVIYAQILNIAIGIGVVLLCALLANQIWGREAGIVAGGIAALSPALIANDATVLAEPLSLLLLLATWWYLIRARPLLAAISLGLLMLTKPSAQLLALFLIAWVVWQFGWRRALRFSAVTLLVILPWIIRNELLIGEPTLNTSNGFNVSARYSEFSENGRDFADAYSDNRFDPYVYLTGDDAAWDKALLKLGTTNFRAHPEIILNVTKRNFLSWFEIDSFRNDLAEKFDGRNMEVRNNTFWLIWPITIIGTVGLVLTLRRRGALLILGSAVLIMATSLFSIVAPRLRSPFDLAMYLGCGAAWAIWRVRKNPSAVASLRDKRRDPLAPSAQSATSPPQSLSPRFWPVIGALLVFIFCSSYLLRERVISDARSGVGKAIDSTAMETKRLQSEYPVTRANALKFNPTTGIAALKNLDRELHLNAPRLRGSEGARASRAALAVRESLVEARVLGAQIAFVAIESDRRGVPFSLAAVRKRYMTLTLAQNAGLPSFDALISGKAIQDASDAIRKAHDSLSSSN